MCGIAGIVKRSGGFVTELIRMSQVQQHRGPDDEGFAIIGLDHSAQFLRGDDTVPELADLPHVGDAGYAGAHIGLLHRRLSIVDLSPAGHQPMECLRTGCIITYNGEVYNWREIKLELQTLGYSFRSECDTEVILTAYIQWGAACVDRFVGMWAFAIWDARKNALFLSRDRFGIKPLYYMAKPEIFAFASEIKALLEVGHMERRVNRDLSVQYLKHGYIDAGQTLFSEVQELPAGYNLYFSCANDKIAVSRYYDIEAAVEGAHSPRSEAESIQKYQSLMTDSIRLHLRADVPVGSCLSGGLDSSVIVGYAATRLEGANFNTFTAAYSDPSVDESRYAAMVNANFSNIEGHFTYPNAQNFWSEFDRLIWHQELPITSTSMYAQWSVMKLAKMCNMKVLLDGQGADESLGGYSYYSGIFLLSLLRQGRLASLLRNACALRRNRSINPWEEVGRAAYHLLPGRVKNLIFSRKRIAGNFLSAEATRMAAHAKPLTIAHTIAKSSVLGMRYGLQDLLRYEDRNSMAFSIESRVPFLDHRLVEYSLSLDDPMKIRQGWLKYVLRKAGEPCLPSEIVWRKDKKGFVTPQRRWKAELKDVLLEYLNSCMFPDILSKKAILNYTTSTINDPTQTSEYWRMISFLKWAEVYNVRN